MFLRFLILLFARPPRRRRCGGAIMLKVKTIMFLTSKKVLDKMIEELSRFELLIQSVRERNEYCRAVVPVHLDIFSLEPDIEGLRFSADSVLSTVREWYNADMAEYLDDLKKEGKDLPWLKGFEEFGKDWKLGTRPGTRGFLDLTWNERQPHYIKFGAVPVTLVNKTDEKGRFFTGEDCQKNRWRYVTRSILEGEVVAMPPEKMLKYGKEVPGVATIDLKKGVAEVLGQAFYSPYYESLAEAMLLRNFAVCYHNWLLEVAKSKK